MKDELKSLIPWRKHSNIIFSGLLTLHGLPRITNYFFTFNHPNYARWLLRYHDNLLKLSELHKDVYYELKKGCFSTKRTKNNFSRLPFDLTLEQTVNRDAASQKTGISYFTNSIFGRRWWAGSHFVRMEALSEVLNKLDMTTKEEVSQDLKPSRIMKNTRDLEKILRSNQGNMNRFIEKENKDRNTISLSCYEQVCLSGLRFERYISHHRAM